MNKKFKNLMIDEMMASAEVFPIISLDENPTEINLNSGDELPILPLRNIVIYPGVFVPVSVARPKSLRLIRHAQANDGLIGACTQMDKKIDDPTIDQLYKMGVAA
ncbi:MAG: endopeptidase La, partial [Porphyromonadaceae bacterium]|nr:endopeptidase La [Porphyromonadaceae bacterium]